MFAIPAAALTRGLRRKPVYLVGLVGLLATTAVTTFATNIVVTLGSRVAAGVFAGLLWAMMAGYARRISPPARSGRALAIASTGVPIGLAQLQTAMSNAAGANADVANALVGTSCAGAAAPMRGPTIDRGG